MLWPATSELVLQACQIRRQLLHAEVALCREYGFRRKQAGFHCRQDAFTALRISQPGSVAHQQGAIRDAFAAAACRSISGRRPLPTFGIYPESGSKVPVTWPFDHSLR